MHSIKNDVVLMGNKGCGAIITPKEHLVDELNISGDYHSVSVKVEEAANVAGMLW